MMTLTAAIASGKKFKRTGGGSFKTKEAFLGGGMTDVDFNATDYILEPVAVTIKETLVIEAWNEAAAERQSIAKAGSSNFYKDFKASLAARGINVLAG